jgi:hypothetical protein
LATEDAGIPAECAVAWLQGIGEAVQNADLPAERADLIHAVYDRIIVAGPTFVSARLTPAAYQHGLALALALPEVVLARPTGVERADAISIRIPIEGAGALTLDEIA